MSYEVEFEIKTTDIKQINFTERCCFCHHISSKINNNYCNICKKYLAYTNQNDSVIISFLNFFHGIAAQKDILFLSWYDFTQSEKIISSTSSHIPSWKYQPERLALFIDTKFCTEEDFSNYSFAITKICEQICSSFYIHNIANNKAEKTLNNFFHDFVQSKNNNIFSVPYPNKSVAPVTPLTRNWLKNQLQETIGFVFANPI